MHNSALSHCHYLLGLEKPSGSPIGLHTEKERERETDADRGLQKNSAQVFVP